MGRLDKAKFSTKVYDSIKYFLSDTTVFHFGKYYFAGLCKVRTGWRRMADADGRWRIEKCG